MPACPSDKCSTKVKMSMGHWWNVTDREIMWITTCPNVTVHHKYLMDWPGTKPKLPW